MLNSPKRVKKTVDLENLGSVGLLRVLKIITKDGPLNISHIGRKANLNHGSVDLHVTKLKEMGLITENRYGAIRMFKPTFRSFSIQFRKGMDVKIIVENQ